MFHNKILSKRTLLLTTIILFISNILFSQINAVTSTGDEVVLYPDGTWKYLNDSVNLKKEIKFNKKLYVKDANSDFLVKSNKLNIGIWINPKDWSFQKGSDNEAAEYKISKT